MNKKSFNYIFVDESGDPGKPYKIGPDRKKIPTGASKFYIISAIPLTSHKLFLLENKLLEIKDKFKYKKEIKSTNISLGLYKALLNILNELEVKIFYRLIDKKKYRGKFAISGNRRLHNVFDEYNLVKVVCSAVMVSKFFNAEVVIDRAERRLLDGKFDNFNDYLTRKLNTRTEKRVSYITHVNSEYVNAMQLTDLISGAIKDDFTQKNTALKKIINKRLLERVW